MKDLPEKKMFHDWCLSRMKHLWFWKGQVICRLFGHRVPKFGNLPWCGRCGIALEEIYGLDYYSYFSIHSDYSEKSELGKLRKAIVICRDINDSGESYNSPNPDSAQALANLFSMVEGWTEETVCKDEYA